MKIAYLTKDDPDNLRHWSGLHYFMQHHLKKHAIEIYSLGPINLWRITFLKGLNRIYNFLFNKGIKPFHTISSSRAYSKMFQKRINKLSKDIDLIFAVNASSELAYLKTNLPCVYLSGTTFELIHEYYNTFSNLFQFNVKANQIIEQSAIQKSSKLIYPSNWAAKSAIRDYGANPNDVHIIPYGANLDYIPTRDEVLKPKKLDQKINLLFVGKDWQRKGGPIALDAVKKLNQYGLETHLTICGCEPNISDELHDLITIYPFLDKDDSEDRETLYQLYKEAHIFILPTQKENFGVVFSEASAYGLPVATTRTGGIPTIIEDERHGLLFSESATGSNYADRLYKLLSDPNRYYEMCRNARDNYEQRLNWNVWSQQVIEVFKQALIDEK